jgi:hypothetical protein
MIKLKDIINEVKLQKGKTYGGTKCEGGCFVGKEGLKKIIKISKDSPKDVFMFRDDNYSGLQPHFIKDGVIAKATVLNPAYDLEKHKVRTLNIGKDVILSVRLFVSTNESINEALTSKEKRIKDGNPDNVFYAFYKGQFEAMYWAMNPSDLFNIYWDEFKVRRPAGSKFKLNPEFIIVSKKEYDRNPNHYSKLKPHVDKLWDKLQNESVNEAKSDYEVYHKSYTSAINAAKAYAEKKGYEINDDDSFRQIGMGPRKPSEGKTNKFSIELSKDGKVQRKKLQIQVYGMRNSYELNAYIQ